MRTFTVHARSRSAAVTLMLALGVLVLPGCDCLVSRSQSLDTSFGEAPQRTTYRVGGTATPPPGSKVVVIPSADAHDDADGDGIVSGGTVVTPAGTAVTTTRPAAGSGGTVTGAQALTADQQRFIASVNTQMTMLTTRMNELAVSAKIKGAAGEAALEPHQRAFNTAKQEVQSRFDNARAASADAAGWSELEAGVSELLKQAQKAVDDAVRDVGAVPTDK